MDLAGYKNIKKISEGHERVVYIALRKSDQRQVVLKSLRAERPSAEMISLMVHEFEISKDLNIPGVIKTYDLVEQQDQFILVQEDMHGISLYEFLNHKPIDSLSLFFNLALQMANILDALHQQYIIHKDIKPSNFIINPKTFEIKLTDFNLSTKLRHEIQELVPPDRLEGTLVYMAPEQSGRMNMNMDYRCDFYALGITFYEMLTGSLPFNYADPLEIIHAHLVAPLPDVCSMNPEIPKILSTLIQRLMAKAPIDRYQSGVGLLSDLARCQKAWDSHHKIDPFELRNNDVYDQLSISQKLYGRKVEAKMILAAYEKVSQGSVSALMVSGYSGIGKTMLINELHKPMVKHKGYFVSGKFDQLQRNTPYTAITQALNRLAKLILAEPEARFNSIKNSILKNIGNVGQVIIDIAPDFELVIGKQPELKNLPPQQAQNRMMIFFRGFLQAIASRSHPLVLFIDDLQWVDSGSLNLLEYILTDSNLSHVLLIGAYRSNEVDDFHPLHQFIESMRKSEKNIQAIKLGPLSTQEFNTLFMDTFKQEEKTVQPLAELIYKFTDGNPFFCKEVINTIYREKLLYFDYKSKHWAWQLDAINNLKISDNVIDLLIDRIDALPKVTRTLLTFAACVGSRFSVDTLLLISNENPDTIGKALWPAMQQELIVTLYMGSKRIDALSYGSLSGPISKGISYQFAHDKVQQAFYQCIDEQAKQKTHLAIARLLIDEKEAVGGNNRLILEITDHYNEAQPLLSEEEKFHAIELNLQSCIISREANAYQSGCNYINFSRQLINISCWETHYELMFSVQREYLFSLVLMGDYSETDSLSKSIIEKAKSTHK